MNNKLINNNKKKNSYDYHIFEKKFKVGSGSVFPNPDPYQKDTDPQHWI